MAAVKLPETEWPQAAITARLAWGLWMVSLLLQLSAFCSWL
jgi:hypothetical protein